MIINADSRQIYNVFPVLTAQPTTQEYDLVQHELYNFCHIDQEYNVHYWLKDVQQVLDNNPNTFPIIVGGTGLYLDAVINGLHTLPERNPNSVWEQKTMADCLTALQKIDPESAEKYKDQRRMIRALDIYDQTGQTMTKLFAQPKKNILQLDCECVFVSVSNLRERISIRLKANFQAMIEEVEAFGLFGAEHIIGVQPIQSYLLGDKNMQQAYEMIYHQTAQYAKRQKTWFEKFYMQHLRK